MTIVLRQPTRYGLVNARVAEKVGRLLLGGAHTEAIMT